MPAVPADFAGAIKGKKNIASLRDAVATELARAKIAANEISGRIQINMTTLRERAAEHTQLFPDTSAIVLKAPEDLASLITARIAEHQAKMQAERDRIAAEERARVEREERAKIEAQARAEAEAATKVRAEEERQRLAAIAEADAAAKKAREAEKATQPAAAVTRITPAITADIIRERIMDAISGMTEADLRRVWDFVSTMREAA